MRSLVALVLVAGCRFGFDGAATGDATGESTGDANDARDATTDAAIPPNLVFITSTTVDLCAVGVAGADAECVARAAAANLPGTYVSWTSDGTSDARDRVASARGWVRPDGRPFADTLADLISGNVLFPPRLDENGADRAAEFLLSATEVDGRLSGSGCMLGGRSSNGGTVWYNKYVLPPSPVACLGIDRAVPVAFTPQTGRLAFVSNAMFTASSGIAAADSICSTEATAAGFVGTFRAFMSTTATPAATRFNLQGLPWVRVDGVPLVASAGDLATFPLLAPLDRLADGTRSSNHAWTGLRAGGGAAQSCNDWSSAAMALGGITFPVTETDNGGFTSVSPSGCSLVLPVLCFQD